MGGLDGGMEVVVGGLDGIIQVLRSWNRRFRWHGKFKSMEAPMIEYATDNTRSMVARKINIKAAIHFLLCSRESVTIYS